MFKQFYIKKEFFLQLKGPNIKEHYDILEVLGKGSFATVYKAKMKYFPYGIRAIKRIQKKYIKKPEEVINQYKILTTLDHPHVIKIYQTFEDQANFFMVLDHCEGGELFKRLDKVGNFTQNDARILFIQMINAIKYCHDNHIAHRDLKPQNFLMLNNNSLDLMLIDFGLSFQWQKSMDKELNIKKGEHLIGTAYYMAPEIIQGKGHYDERCDIWSLGIILFMLVTGEPPVAGQTSEEIIKNLKSGKILLDTLNRKKLNPKLIDLIKRILQPEQKRISVKEIMSHDWMHMPLSPLPLQINFEKIRNYSKLSELKILVVNYIASQLSQKDIMILGKTFLEIDENKDGFLTVEELSNYLIKEKNISNLMEINDIIEHMDVDHNGKLNYNQFISACLSKSASNNRQYLLYAFQNFDLNHDGKISRDQLTIILNAYKKQFEDNQELINQIIDNCDQNKDNFIDFEEFCHYITKQNQN